MGVETIEAVGEGMNRRGGEKGEGRKLRVDSARRGLKMNYVNAEPLGRLWTQTRLATLAPATMEAISAFHQNSLT